MRTLSKAVRERVIVAGVRGEDLPGPVECNELDLAGTPIRSLPGRLRVVRKLVLRDCAAVERLPDGLAVATLDVSGCDRLSELPAGLTVRTLKAAGSGVEAVPAGLRAFDVDLSGTSVERLPD